MPLKSLDVIKVYDTEIDPANWKRWVCICPDEGLFYRINSNDDFPIGVPISRDPHHAGFLEWDSFIECGKQPLELDDYRIGKALERTGNKPWGRVHSSLIPQILAAVQLQGAISREVKRLIQLALRS